MKPGAPHGTQAGIADALGELSDEVEAMGAVLCADLDIATRHLDQLQAIDRIGQSLREISRVLAANDPDAAIGDIGLGELHERLERASAV
jgi:hypothetical protein